MEFILAYYLYSIVQMKALLLPPPVIHISVDQVKIIVQSKLK